MNKRALIAMSGGVDSSVTAAILKEQGFECTGVTMVLFDRDRLTGDPCDAGIPAKDEDAGKVSELLGIPHVYLDLRDDFRSHVMGEFCRIYEAGETPNPCVICNSVMKFGKLMEYADAEGMDHIATGHYARIIFDPTTGKFILKKSLDVSKDQSYVLYSLRQEQLARLHFPLGELDKDDVRRKAAQQCFSNADRKDSQDICFITDGDYGSFLESFRGEAYEAGDFIDTGGEILGQHKGAVRYTLGQRKGLGIAMGEPVYVVAKDMSANTVTLGREELLFSEEVSVADVNWISGEAPVGTIRVKVKTRYRQKEAPASVTPGEGNGAVVIFDEPQRAVTPGQAAVFYDGDTVIGGGRIVSSVNGAMTLTS